MKVTIIGAGIIGLCSAYFLKQKGVDVEIFDSESEQYQGCSYGNAGFLVPSHIVPLASPGVISKGLKWMMNSSSPFYMKPGLDPVIWSWIRSFMKYANPGHVNRSAGLIKNMSLESMGLYTQMIEDNHLDMILRKDGIYMIYSTEKGEKEERETSRLLDSYLMKNRLIGNEELQNELGIKVNSKGALHFLTDVNLDPVMLMNELKRILKESGVRFYWNTSLEDFVLKGNRVAAIKTKDGELKVDQLLLTAGVYTRDLLKKLRVKIPLVAGKGYSMDGSLGEFAPKKPCLFSEAKLAINPMGDRIRFAGTLEINGNDSSIDNKRVAGMIKSIKNYFPEYPTELLELDKIWSGLRPCSPDGLPIMGKVPASDNCFIATGHAMLGISLGAYSGKAISELITEGIKLPKEIILERF